MEYYKSIVDLPLNKFIECYVDENLYALVISGDVEKQNLTDAWENIVLEYNDAMSDAETKMYISLLKETSLLQAKYKLVEMAILRLSIAYNKEMHDDLNNFTSSNLLLDPSKPDEYKKELEKAGRRSKSMLIQYELKRNQLAAMEEKNQVKTTKPTREYFQSVLITLSDFAKYELKDTITVYNFCERVRRYGQHIKMVEENNNKRK
jgi:hypothetical protein